VIEVKKLISKFLAHSVVVGELELTVGARVSRWTLDHKMRNHVRNVFDNTKKVAPQLHSKYTSMNVEFVNIVKFKHRSQSASTLHPKTKYKQGATFIIVPSSLLLKRITSVMILYLPPIEPVHPPSLA